MAIKQNTELDTKTVGSYNQGKDIEFSTISEIEISKGQLMTAFSSFKVEDIKSQMKDLFKLIESFLLGGYFSDEEVENYRYPERGDSFNFNEYFTMIDYTDDINALREIATNVYIIYNKFKVKRLNISVATGRSWGKEKIYNAAFFLTNSRFNEGRRPPELNEFLSNFIDLSIELGFCRELKSGHLQWFNSNSSWDKSLGSAWDWYLPYIQSQLNIYDIDFLLINFGIARSGKSNKILDGVRRTLCYQKKQSYDDISENMVGYGFLDSNFVYDKKTDLREWYKANRNSDLVIDEGYLAGTDKREIIKSQELKLISSLNAYASHNNRTHVLIQNYAHLDFRLKDKALCDEYVYRRAEVMLFSEFKNAFAQNVDYYDADTLDNFILTDPERLKNYLQRKDGFIKELHPKQLNEEKDPLYIDYLEWKKNHQDILI